MRTNYSKIGGSRMTADIFSSLHALWCTEEYNEDYLKILMERENKRLEFNFQSPQISERKRLVDWMRTIAVQKGLDNFSIHLAVYLLDVFMDSYNIIADKLQLLAVVCLLLATKFEERECNVLKTTEMNDLLDNKYTNDDFHGLEVIILKHLNWDLLLPTVVHFVNFDIEFLFTEDDFPDTDVRIEKRSWLDARHIIKNYMDFVMEDVRLMHEKPSLVGAAIIAQTRVVLRFTKIWPKRLNEITGYKYLELKPIVLRIKQMNKKKITSTQ